MHCYNSIQTKLKYSYTFSILKVPETKSLHSNIQVEKWLNQKQLFIDNKQTKKSKDSGLLISTYMGAKFCNEFGSKHGTPTIQGFSLSSK